MTAYNILPKTTMKTKGKIWHREMLKSHFIITFVGNKFKIFILKSNVFNSSQLF